MTERNLVGFIIECNPDDGGNEDPDVKVSVLPLVTANEDGVRLSSRPFFGECKPDDITECQRRILEALSIKPTEIDPMKLRDIEQIWSIFERDEEKTIDEYFEEILREVFGLYVGNLNATQRRKIEIAILEIFPPDIVFISWKQSGEMIKQALTGNFKDRGYEEA